VRDSLAASGDEAEATGTGRLHKIVATVACHASIRAGDAMDAAGDYLGGAISPGLGISADALFSRAARLGRVDIRRPAKVIGTNTVTHIQSGLYYGYIGLVDGILERIMAELGVKARVIATGGLARQISEDSRYIDEIDDMLTLDGLRILFERNRTPRPRSRAS